MENEYTDYSSLAELLATPTAALTALAMRPQKTSSVTTTYQTSTPRALQDMIKNRDSIRTVSRELDEALQPKEDRYMYRLGRGLSNITPTKGYGSWLSGALRAFGGGLTSGTDLRAERLQQKYENEMKDLAEILAYDKAMGDYTSQTQKQEIGYTPMEFGALSGAARGAAGKGAGLDLLGSVQSTNFGRSVGYDPAENLPDFGAATRAALSEEEMGHLGKYIPLSQSLAKGVSGDKAVRLQSTWADISDNILSGRVLDFVGKAGSIRVADTPDEQEFIFGPIRNYKNMSKDQLRAGLKQSRNNFVALGMAKARERKKVDPTFEISEQELKDWWNSAFSVPEGMQTETMYNIQDREEVAGPTQKSISVGGIRNGWRFMGGDPKKKENWEKVK